MFAVYFILSHLTITAFTLTARRIYDAPPPTPQVCRELVEDPTKSTLLINTEDFQEFYSDVMDRVNNAKNLDINVRHLQHDYTNTIYEDIMSYNSYTVFDIPSLPRFIKKHCANRYGDPYENRYAPLMHHSISEEDQKACWANPLMLWIAKQHEIPSIEHDSVRYIDRYTANSAGCGLIIGDSFSDKFKEFIRAAGQFEDYIIVNSNSEEVRLKYGQQEESIVLFGNGGTERQVLEGGLSYDDYLNFIKKTQYSGVFQFRGYLSKELNRDNVILIKDDSEKSRLAEEVLKKIEIEHRGEFLFMMNDINAKLDGNDEKEAYEYLVSTISIKPEELPAIRLINGQYNTNKLFVLDGEITEESVRSSLDKYKERNNKSRYIDL